MALRRCPRKCSKPSEAVDHKRTCPQTDHKPLENIFKKLLLQAPKSLQRMLLQLQRYHLKLLFKPGRELSIADTLSRAYLPNEPAPEKSNCGVFAVRQEEYLIKFIEETDMVNFLPITAERLADLREKTVHEESLQKLKHVVKIVWPENKKEIPPEIRNYFHFKEKLTIQDDMLYSDNGSRFTSREFEEFASDWPFDHQTSSPHYPPSNGQIDNAAKIAKRLLTKSKTGGQDACLAILDWRNTPSEDVSRHPCQLLGH
ncbi:hypothetical protein ACROYT_G011550 [Oculina patagonica]